MSSLEDHGHTHSVLTEPERERYFSQFVRFTKMTIIIIILPMSSQPVCVCVCYTGARSSVTVMIDHNGGFVSHALGVCVNDDDVTFQA